MHSAADADADDSGADLLCIRRATLFVDPHAFTDFDRINHEQRFDESLRLIFGELIT